MTDAATLNLMTGLRTIVIVGLGALALYGGSMAIRYTNKHADDPISRSSAELSVALWSIALAIPLMALAYIAWAMAHGFVAFSDTETALNITAMALLAVAGFYLSRGRTLLELLRRRKEWH